MVKVEHNDDFLTIDGEMYMFEDVDIDFGEVRDNGKLIYSEPEIIDIYEYKNQLYSFYWDTPSGCISSLLTKI